MHTKHIQKVVFAISLAISFCYAQAITTPSFGGDKAAVLGITCEYTIQLNDYSFVDLQIDETKGAITSLALSTDNNGKTTATLQVRWDQTGNTSIILTAGSGYAPPSNFDYRIFVLPDEFTNTYDLMYDANGNRIKREAVTISILKSENIADAIAEAQSKQAEGILQDATPNDSDQDSLPSTETIRIYPNPTEGLLHVKIDETLQVENTCDGLQLTSVSGTKIAFANCSGTEATYDLTSLPAGVYVLSMELRGKTNTWAITKY